MTALEPQPSAVTRPPPSRDVASLARASAAAPPEAAAPASGPATGAHRLDALLQERFGLPSLHAWQREAIDALLGGSGRVLVVAPTGGGKSLCYQLPAVALEGTTLVLSPLISLMEDQVRSLEARGISATFVASSLPREENGRRLAGLRRGDYKVVYAAPERLAFDGFLDTLEACRLSLVAIDEAHCIVQWGHDFRPDYMRIGEALKRLGPRRVLACTATASPEDRDEIIRRLGWGAGAGAEGGPEVVLRGFARPNLALRVQHVAAPREALRQASRALHEALGDPRAPRGAGIVYAATRKGVEKLAAELAAEGFDARPYHAGLPPEERAEVSAAFAERRVDLVVATNAFGMGIDRPDVRVVVHAQPPSTLEAYYQEVGRAGRDGAPAAGLLLLAPADIALRRRMCQRSSDGQDASEADAARAWAQFCAVLRYVDAATCRHDFILRHFGDEAESLGGCGQCDVCLEVRARDAEDPEAQGRDLDVVRRALAGVARTRGRAGMQAIASMLTGESTAQIERLGLTELSTFGVLSGHTTDRAMTVLRVLLASGWIALEGEFPVPHLTPLGWRVMRAELPVPVRLPPAERSRAPRGDRAPRSRARGAALAVASDGPEPDAGLYGALRAWRTAEAKERSVPAFVVASDRTLREVALQRPGSMDDLLLAHGIGPTKAATHGDALLQIVREHATEE